MAKTRKINNGKHPHIAKQRIEDLDFHLKTWEALLDDDTESNPLLHSDYSDDVIVGELIDTMQRVLDKTKQLFVTVKSR